MTDPNVVYDFINNQITVDVVVDDHIVAGLPVLRPGQWNVTWKLISDLDLVFQPDDGIKIDDGPNAPPALTHEELIRESDGHAVSIVFHNECQSANAVSYFINLEPGPGSPDLEKRVAGLPLHHDPTLSVISDPPAG